MNWSQQIDKTTTEFNQYFGSLDGDALNWTPNSSVWSIAQNIDHLIVINSTYFPVLAALHAGTYKPPFISRVGFLVSFFGKTVLNAAQPDRINKMKTFPLWEPTQSEIDDKILERFNHHQAELKEQIEACGDLLKKNTVISSPANRNIVYKLETAFDIIVNHEQRHLGQAKEILQLWENENSKLKT